MSSLIFYIDETQAIVATDTLATDTEGRPLKFTSKAFVVPHLKLIMAGVGIHGFLGRWFVHMTDYVLTRGIDHLDYHTPHILSKLWQGYKQELSIPDGMTTTIYHLGFSEKTSQIHAFAYRSTENFRSERLAPYGLRVKPECEIPAEYTLPPDIVPMMNRQREIQSSKPRAERLYIGGEIEVRQPSVRAGFFGLHAAQI